MQGMAAKFIRKSNNYAYILPVEKTDEPVWRKRLYCLAFYDLLSTVDLQSIHILTNRSALVTQVSCTIPVLKNTYKYAYG